MVCQELELPDSKREAAETAYNTVGGWLNECPVLQPFRVEIFPQGSVALGTTVKPLDREEFDVDLLCFLSLATEALPQAYVKRAVGHRLSSHSTYSKMLEEFKRCWRLNYSAESQLHLDITPAVKNSKCLNGGLCVTDKEAWMWQPTNPKGYVISFQRYAALQPSMAGQGLKNRGEITAKMAPFPEHVPLKGFLRRIVQLAKRHRSIYFEHRPEKAPISVILTTLACKAYAAAVHSRTIYETEFDLLCDVINRLPEFIEQRWNNGRIELWVPNETIEGENFAEKWNKDPELPKAFADWHKSAVHDFQALAETGDAETTFSVLKTVAGAKITASVRNRATQTVSTARFQGLLRSAPAGTLSGASGVPVVANTFFGS
jgi:hypothetical protein